MVDFDPLEESDIEYLREKIEKHAEYTDSSVAKRLLEDWTASLKKFIKVIPVDYKRALALLEDEEKTGE
jgi:glutamate synthase domain-containing protein 3